MKMIITKDDENLINDIFSKLNKDFVFDKSKLDSKIIIKLINEIDYFKVYYNKKDDKKIIRLQNKLVKLFKKYEGICHPYELFKDISYDENMDRKLQKIALDLKYSNLYFAKPFYSKEYWEYSALVLKKRAYPTIGDVILELFDWLKDINWPGSMTIKEILYSIPRNILIKYLEEVINKANSSKDVVWLENLYNFSIELNIKETEFKNKKTSKILNNLDNKNLSTD